MFTHRFFEGGELPASYCAESGVILFHTDFRRWLRYEHLLGEDLPGNEKAARCVEAVIDRLPPGTKMEEVGRAASWFHSCADVERLERIDIPPNIARELNERRKTSSLFWDFKQVWDSFKQQYDIDLYSCGEMHWWEFRRLLSGLKPDTPFAAGQRLRGLTLDDFKGHDGKMNSKGRSDWNATKLDQIYHALPGMDDNSINED